MWCVGNYYMFVDIVFGCVFGYFDFWMFEFNWCDCYLNFDKYFVKL